MKFENRDHFSKKHSKFGRIPWEIKTSHKFPKSVYFITSIRKDHGTVNNWRKMNSNEKWFLVNFTARQQLDRNVPWNLKDTKRLKALKRHSIETFALGKS